MVEFKIDARSLREFADIVVSLNQEAKIDFTNKGLSTKIIDPAHIAMVLLEIDKDTFQDFKVEDEESIGIDIERLRNAMKLASSTDIINFKADGKRISIKYGNLSYNIPIIDPSSISTQKMPNLVIPNKIITDFNLVLTGIKAAENFADVVTFHMKTDELKILAKGESDLENAELSIPKSLAKEYVFSEEAKSSYSLDYLSNFVRSLESVTDISIMLKTDYPLKIEAPVFNGKGKVTFILAPRIESI